MALPPFKKTFKAPRPLSKTPIHLSGGALLTDCIELDSGTFMFSGALRSRPAYFHRGITCMTQMSWEETLTGYIKPSYGPPLSCPVLKF